MPSFGKTPLSFNQQMERAGMTRTERILSDGNPYEVESLITEGNNASYRKGVVTGAFIGLLGLAFNRR